MSEPLLAENLPSFAPSRLKTKGYGSPAGSLSSTSLSRSLSTSSTGTAEHKQEVAYGSSGGASSTPHHALASSSASQSSSSNGAKAAAGGHSHSHSRLFSSSTDTGDVPLPPTAVDDGGGEAGDPALVVRLYGRRWWVLFVFSWLAFLNNMVCYSFAAVSTSAEDYYQPSISLAWLINVYFIVFVATAFLASRMVDKYGFHMCVVIGAWLQAAGTSLRFLSIQSIPESAFFCVLIGQAIAALAQGFFLNTPPVLSAVWFGETERTLATTVAVNANTLGIAGAYLFAPYVVRNTEDVPNLNEYVAGACFLFATVATFTMPAVPPSPPSLSNQLRQNAANSFTNRPWSEEFRAYVHLFKQRGFVHTVITFAVAESVVNAFSTFMESMLGPLGFSDTYVSVMGAAFIVSALVGSGIVGYVVDRWKWYKASMIFAFVTSTGALVFFTIVSADKPEPDHTRMAVAILAMGFFVGPIHPISIETAAECTYPASESTFSAIQQVVGNILSAAFVPCLAALETPDHSFERADWVMVGCMACAGLFFVFWKGEYRRLKLEHGEKLENPEDPLLLPSATPKREKSSSNFDADDLEPIQMMRSRISDVTVTAPAPSDREASRVSFSERFKQRFTWGSGSANLFNGSYDNEEDDDDAATARGQRGPEGGPAGSGESEHLFNPYVPAPALASAGGTAAPSSKRDKAGATVDRREEKRDAMSGSTSSTPKKRKDKKPAVASSAAPYAGSSSSGGSVPLAPPPP